MIQLSAIRFSYPQSDFELGIDLMDFKEGSKTAIIGPSGFGKTTMLNLIAGILQPDAGQVKINESVINSLSEKERRNYRIQNIGFVFQDFRLVAYLSVLDNILLPYRINNIIKPDAESTSRAISIADDLNIGNLIKKFPAKLSHGERQRVAIARALINKPRILLADEPTGNLDPANKLHIKNILFDVVAKHRATLITVTHDHEMLTGFDHVIDFKNFKKVAVS
jgi:putative ABC transport system ATP-binding protein